MYRGEPNQFDGKRKRIDLGRTADKCNFGFFFVSLLKFIRNYLFILCIQNTERDLMISSRPTSVSSALMTQGKCEVNFFQFDPLRTLQFLTLELSSKLKTILPGLMVFFLLKFCLCQLIWIWILEDRHIHKILYEIKQTIRRFDGSGGSCRSSTSVVTIQVNFIYNFIPTGCWLSRSCIHSYIHFDNRQQKWRISWTSYSAQESAQWYDKYFYLELKSSLGPTRSIFCYYLCCYLSLDLGFLNTLFEKLRMSVPQHKL